VDQTGIYVPAQAEGRATHVSHRGKAVQKKALGYYLGAVGKIRSMSFSTVSK
jgi:hypothetical protein